MAFQVSLVTVAVMVLVVLVMATGTYAQIPTEQDRYNYLQVCVKGGKGVGNGEWEDWKAIKEGN